MLYQADGVLTRLDMDIVINAIHHLRHLARKRHATGLEHQLSAVDINGLELPGALSPIKCLLDRTNKRMIGSLNRILACFVNVKNCTTRFEHAEMVALHR